MTHSIRPIDPADPMAIRAMTAYFAELAALFPGGFDPGPLTEDTLAPMRPPLGQFLMAFDGTTPTGCVGLRQEDAKTGEVKRLWVAPTARQSGLARALMAQIEDHARQMGLTRLVLDTSRHLPKAVAFYHRQGWAEIARYNDNPYAHHFFERGL